ncbi:MAG: histidine kinase N-terminal 7TM domain-containing protein [Halanaerobiales bacterium]
MKYQFIPYLIPLTISFIIVIFLALYGYRRRKVRGAKFFVLSMLVGALWVLGNGLEMAGTELSFKLFWANIQYISYGFAPLAWLMMVLQFTDRSHLVNRRNLIIMSIIPLVTVILVWLDHGLGLVRYGFSLDSSGPFPVIGKEYGLWFWVHIVYCYILNFTTVIFLLSAVLHKSTIYKKQAFYLLTGFSVLMISNLLYISGLSPLRNDISPVVFSLTGAIIARGIFHFRLFELVPVARTTVIEKMEVGIVVLDMRDRVIDINLEARKMLGIDGDIKVDRGPGLKEISVELQKFVSSSREQGTFQTEMEIEAETGEHFFEVYVSPIRDEKNDLIARALMINDITELKEARQEINAQREEMAVMKERNRMARELHDNLGQILSFSNVQIQAVRRELKKEDYGLAGEHLERLSEIIKGAHKDVREYVYNIREDSRYKEDIFTLLKEEVAEFRGSMEGKVVSNLDSFLVEGDSLNPDILKGTEEKMQIVNIMKGALNNIVKHAGAGLVRINISTAEHSFQLIIEDDGKGITERDKERASGLNIMAERARLINASLKIESEAGIGTRVTVGLPL